MSRGKNTVEEFTGLLRTTGLSAVASAVAVFAVISADVSVGDAKLSIRMATSAHAQEDRPSRPETRQVKTLSRAGGPIYTEAYEAYEAENYDVALTNLNKIINGGSTYSDYDIGRAREMRAFIYSDRGDYSTALSDLKAAITPADRLNSEETLRIRYALAQLYLHQGNYSQAIAEFERWFSEQVEPPAQAYMQFAQAYVLAGQIRKALPYAEKGYSMLTEPNENWYRLMATIYLQLQQFSNAIPVLERILTYWPTNKDYFSQLAYSYSSVNRDEDSFAIQALAYHNGLLTSNEDIVRVAQLYRAYGYPYKAAEIMSKEMQAGRVTKNKKNWEELGFAWAQAREHKRAIPPLTNAASAAGDGKLFYQLCQTYFFDENWSKATSTCRNALNKGGLNPETRAIAWMLIGNAEYKTEDRDKAIEAFNRCQDVTGEGVDDTVQGCNSWVGFIEQEIALEKREAARQKREEEALQKRQSEQEAEVRKVLEQQGQFRETVNGAENGAAPGDAPQLEAPAPEPDAEAPPATQ